MAESNKNRMISALIIASQNERGRRGFARNLRPLGNAWKELRNEPDFRKHQATKQRGEYERTEIMYAASHGKLNNLKQLLKRNIPDQLEVMDAGVRTRLFMGAGMGHAATVEFLISIGANIEVIDEEEHTPLAIACINGHAATVKVLIDGGANIEMADTDTYGQPPLFLASTANHADVVKILIDAGANLEAVGYTNQRALFAASEKGHIDVVNALIDGGANTEVGGYDNQTPLWVASRNGHVDVVVALLHAGANKEALGADNGYDFRNNNFLTPLLIATSEDRVDVVRELVNAGVNIEASDNRGITALKDACVNCNVDIARILISAGANKNIPGLSLNVMRNCKHPEGGEILELLKDETDENWVTAKSMYNKKSMFGGYKKTRKNRRKFTRSKTRHHRNPIKN